MKKTISGLRGFTLIELLVVVLIIGILASVALPQYQRAVVKSHVAGVMPYLKAVKDAEEIYYLSNNTYTKDLTELDLEVTCPDQWECKLMESDIAKIEAYYKRADGHLQIISSFDHRADHTDRAGVLYCFASSGYPKWDNFCKAMGPALTGGASGTRYRIN